MSEPPQDRGLKWGAIGIAVGSALGAAIGLALDDLGLWLSIGIALGVAVGAGIAGQQEPPEEQEPNE